MPTSFDLVIRSATVVGTDGVGPADVGVRGSQIADIGDLAQASAREVLHAEGLHLLPGVIDTQVHFREPGWPEKEDIESGSRAAVVGGVTSYFEMPNTNPPTIDESTLADKLARAAGRSWANYGFFIGASPENVGRLAELEALPGTPGIKLFMGSSTGDLVVAEPGLLREVVRNGRRRMSVHAESEAILAQEKAARQARAGLSVADHPIVRPARAAVEAVAALVELCRQTRRPIHILHVASADEIPLISRAKQEGLPITAEVTPQHLMFCDADYARLGTLIQQNPPIRSERDRAALWAALSDGVFDVFGSDHAPHTLQEKARDYPNSPSGMPGVQTMLPILLDWVNEGRLTLQQVVRMTSELPARLFGVRDKGGIAPGLDADLVLVDLRHRWTIERRWVESRAGWSPFEGMTISGKPIATVVGGVISLRDGEIVGTPAGRPVGYEWKE
jgi:dihydroorotase